MVNCGGCGEDVRQICKDHPGANVQRDNTTLYFICDGGQGPEPHMPHYAICENPPNYPAHYLTLDEWSH